MQCVAMCCNVLHCVAVCCIVLQSVAVCCSVLQRIVLCCSVLQRHSRWTCRFGQLFCLWVRQNIVLQCVEVCCSVLQCVAVCCSVTADGPAVSVSYGVASISRLLAIIGLFIKRAL